MRKKCLILIFFMIPWLALPAKTHAEPKRSVGIGMGMSYSYPSYPTVEFNLRASAKIPIELVYKYYFVRGLEASLKIYAVEKKYIRWHVFNPGAYFLLGTEPLAVRNTVEDRGFDITFGSGVDVMPWKNLVISISLRWFLPGFGSAYAAGQKAALEYAVENFTFDSDKTIEEIVLENGEAAFEVASRKTKDIYKQAMKEPHFQITLTWYFF